MTRVDDLIANPCPTGVEFKALSDCVVRPQGIRWSDHLGQQFQYIDLTSVDRATHKIVSTATITSDTAPSRAQQIVRAGDVLFGTTRPTLKRYAVIPPDYDGQICSTGFCVLRPDTRFVLTNYLFHLLGTRAFCDYIEANERGASYPGISDALVKRFRIPVPPLEVQLEVSGVLDVFAEPEAGLEAELEAELGARRQQFEYYRDLLLSFRAEGVQWVPLRELGVFIRGKRFTKRDYDADGVGCIHYGEIYTHFGTSARSVISRVRSDLAPTLRFADPGDVVIVDVGETVEDVGKAVAWLGREPVAIHDHSYAFRHAMNPAFVSYVMQTAAFRAERAKFIARTKVKTLLIEGFSRIAIPVPSREEQDRIVAILDKFDALVNDLSIGLPAELNARRQQYEHYRDRLLTFPEAA